MSKREKIKFEDLEKLGDGNAPPGFSESELLSFIKESDSLPQDRRVEFLGTLFSKMSESANFRGRVLKILEENKKE